MRSHRDEIENTLRLRLYKLKDRRQVTLNNVLRCLRAMKLRPLVNKTSDDSDLTSRCVEDFSQAVSSKTLTEQSRTTADSLVKLIEKKREYAIEFIARRQLVNTKNSVLAYIKKRFFSYKKNFQYRHTVPWIRDLPLRPNLNDQIFFDWKTQQENKLLLSSLFFKSFTGVIRDFEILDDATFTFKMARALNHLFYTINAIDWGEYNSLNFLFKIFKVQSFDFDTMIQEITEESSLPSPDPAVLHDHVFPVFTRINYFDYNDIAGEMKEAYDNALFVLRPELFPFLVSEYVMFRFLLRNVSEAVKTNILEKIRRHFDHGTIVSNVCQMFPGAFTILFLSYFNNRDHSDPKGVLNILTDVRSTVSDTSKVTRELKYVSNFICEVVYDLEQKNIRLSKDFQDQFLSNITFIKYNYFVASSRPQPLENISAYPFLVR